MLLLSSCISWLILARFSGDATFKSSLLIALERTFLRTSLFPKEERKVKSSRSISSFVGKGPYLRSSHLFRASSILCPGREEILEKRPPQRRGFTLPNSEMKAVKVFSTKQKSCRVSFKELTLRFFFDFRLQESMGAGYTNK